MKLRLHMQRLLLPALAAVVLNGCGSGPSESSRGSGRALTREELVREGNLLYLQRQYDTAAVLLKRAYVMDSTSADAALALASLHFDRGKEEPAGSRKATEFLRQSLRYYKRVEEGGGRDADLLDRLCEVSVLLNDDRSFLRYARRNAELYPYERQVYNLGLACFGAAEYQNVVKTQKEAIDRFKSSAYLGGYYRLLGLAYVKQDRDQTAERTFLAGLKAVESLLAELKREEKQRREEISRLSDDRIGILQQLRRIFRVYKKQAELEQVERQLRDAGQNP